MINLTRGWLLVALACGALGCKAPRVGPSQMPRQGNVYLMRGLLDVFSLGVNKLARDLRAEGVDAQTLSGPAWRDLSWRIKQAYREGELQGPLIFAGHSYGADHAIDVARDLKDAGIEVELLALMDAVVRPAVPANVVRVYHVYRPSLMGKLLPSIFAGSSVEAEEGNQRTELVNHDLTIRKDGARVLLIGHLSIEESDLVRELIKGEILRVCGPIQSHQPTPSAGVSTRASQEIPLVTGRSEPVSR